MAEYSKERHFFDERFVACQDHLFGYIASLLPRRDDVNEVFQETNLKLLQNWDKYDPSRPFLPWAFTIALNEVRSFVRRGNRKGGMLSDEMLTAVSEEQFRSARQIDESLNHLSECLGKLTAEKRALLRECYAGDQPIRAIAAGKHISADSLYKQLERLRRALLECMTTRYMDGLVS
ncbi:MAG: sigma-70 family RNA polymerase sigma factor [Thermoguttaceae bacterium]